MKSGCVSTNMCKRRLFSLMNEMCADVLVNRGKAENDTDEDDNLT